MRCYRRQTERGFAAVWAVGVIAGLAIVGLGYLFTPEIEALLAAPPSEPAGAAAPAAGDWVQPKRVKTTSITPEGERAAAAARNAPAAPRPVASPPASVPSAVPPPQTTEQRVKVAAVIAAIVRGSRDAYYASGKGCACPDDRTPSGERCGSASAYGRAGAAAVFCYATDVPPAMVEARLAGQ